MILYTLQCSVCGRIFYSPDKSQTCDTGCCMFDYIECSIISTDEIEKITSDDCLQNKIMLGELLIFSLQNHESFNKRDLIDFIRTTEKMLKYKD